MKRLSTALLILLVSACARSEEASLVSADGNQGYNRVDRVGTPEADDREPAIGQWRLSLQENAQVLEFGPMGTEPLFSLACTGNRTVLLQRHGGAPAGPLPAMQVSKGQANEQFQVSMGGGAVPMLRAELSLQSGLAQAMGAEGEPLLIRLGDGAPLVLPASGLIGDYLRTCATARPGAATGGANMAAPIANDATPVPQTNGAAPVAVINVGPANAAQPK
jgi:hypothetical protein